MFAVALAGLKPRQRRQRKSSSGVRQRLLENPPLVEPSVLAQLEALVRAIDHDRVLSQARLVEVVANAAHAVVYAAEAASV